MRLPPLVEVAVVVLANGAAAWLLTYLLHSTLLVALAELLERKARLAPADRAWTWRAALLAPPLTAAGHLLAAGAGAPLSVEVASLSDLLGARTGLSLGVVVAGVLVLAVLVALLLGGWLRLRFALGPRRPARPEDLELLTALRATTRGPEAKLTVSARLVAPAAVGGGEICLPAATFDTLSVAQRQALLAHELGHLARRDPAWLGLATAVSWVLFVQPLNRLALRRLRDSSEQAADDFAVRATRDARALATALASVATVLVALLGGASAAGSPLVARVARLLGPGREREVTTPRRWRLLATTVVILVMALVGPGVGVSVDRAGNAIAWLAPSREPPNARMLEVRRFERAWRDSWRQGPGFSR